MHQHVANYPGVTIERTWGHVRLTGTLAADVVDLPGIYSLTPVAPDENVAMESLVGLLPGEPVPDLICLVVDATNLARNLLLFSQLVDLGRPLVVALNLMDVAESEGLVPRVARLEALLGVPVVPVVARTGRGLVALRQAFFRARRPTVAPWWTDSCRCDRFDAIVASLDASPVIAALPLATRRAVVHHLVLSEVFVQARSLRGDPALLDLVRAFGTECRNCQHDHVGRDINARYAWIEVVLQAVMPSLPGYRPSVSDRLDRWLLHPVVGLAAFALIMAGVFILAFTAAAPLAALLERGIGHVGAVIADWLPAGLPRRIWAEGVVDGVGAVLVFVPQIALLFLALTLLEASGYLARCAFLLDRGLSRVGLHGASFIPLLSSHGCAVPGIMATRVIRDRRDRLITLLVAPFMTCSARLPVYALLIGILFAGAGGWYQGLILSSLYAFGILAAVLVAIVLRHGVFGPSTTPFMLELPDYHLPDPRSVFQTVTTRVGQFVRKAGGIILIGSLIVWAINNFPRLPEERRAALVASYGQPVAIPEESLPAPVRIALGRARLDHSLGGRLGRLLEPVVEPLGFDRRIAVGLVSAFAAREMFVATMGVVYAADGVDGTDLRTAMLRERRPDGGPVWTPLLAINLLLWFAIAMQCIPTTAVVRREAGGWSWALGQTLAYNLLAWLVCCGVWQLCG
jgi:ferrous iron transport protein B